MNIYNFEDLEIWQLSRILVKDVYATFAHVRDFGFNDQIQRAAVSIMNNIAEGFERSKISQNNKEYIVFLKYSHGSCAEVKNMLYIAEDLKYCDSTTATSLRNQCININIKICFLVNYLSTHEKPNIHNQHT